MTLDEKLKALRVKLDENRSKVPGLKTEIRGLVEKAETEEELKAAQAKRSALEKLNEEIRKDEATEALYVEAIEGNTVPAQRHNENNANHELRNSINAFIRSKGKKTEGLTFRDNEVVIPGEMLRAGETPTTGITSTDAESVIPVAVSYSPQRELQTVIDLKQFANVFAATTASGKYPMLKNVKAVLNSVAELEENPNLIKPDFDKVDWEVQTYRGAIPLSQESIDDAEIDLIGIVAENANQQKLNTTNQAIAGVLKTFTAKTTATLDDLKHIINVDIDPAYTKAMVTSQSYYNWLDTLKDGNGRYLMQDSIISPSGKTVLGMPVFVVADTTFGAAGEAHAFIGDVKRAVLFANRADITITWAKNEIYGQYLQVATRFDAKAADKQAGFFLTQSDSPKG